MSDAALNVPVPEAHRADSTEAVRKILEKGGLIDGKDATPAKRETPRRQVDGAPEERAPEHEGSEGEAGTEGEALEADARADGVEPEAPQLSDEDFTFREAAKALGVNPKELMETMQIEVRAPGEQEHEKLSLAQLHDRYIELRGESEQRGTIQQAQNELETDRIETLQTLSALVNAIEDATGRTMSREVWEAAGKAYGVKLEREARKLVTLIPEWQDGNRRAADKRAIVQWVKPFGLTPADVENISDARWVVALRRAALTEQAGIEARAKAVPRPRPEPGRAPSQEPSASRRLRETINRARTGTQSQKTDAVRAILRSAGHGNK